MEGRMEKGGEGKRPPTDGGERGDRLRGFTVKRFIYFIVLSSVVFVS